MGSINYAVLLIFINIIIWVSFSLVPRLKDKKMVCLVLSFISLWFFLSVREPYSDAIAYKNYFNSLDVENFSVIFKNRWEILFKVLLLF